MAVNMTVIDPLNPIGQEHIEDFEAFAVCIDRRVMEEDDRLAAQRLPRLQRQLQPAALPV